MHASKLLFCGFSMGSNQYWAGRVYDLYVYFMTGTPEVLALIWQLMS